MPEEVAGGSGLRFFGISGGWCTGAARSLRSVAQVAPRRKPNAKRLPCAELAERMFQKMRATEERARSGATTEKRHESSLTLVADAFFNC